MSNPWRKILAIAALISVLVVVLAVLFLAKMWQYRAAWIEGKRNYESHNYAAAAGSFRRMCELAPWDAEAHYWFANALGFSHHVDEAEKEMRKAVKLDPSNGGY